MIWGETNREFVKSEGEADIQPVKNGSKRRRLRHAEIEGFGCLRPKVASAAGNPGNLADYP